MVLLGKPDIFFRHLMLFVHGINYCTLTTITTLQTHITLLPSSTPFGEMGAF